MSHNEGGEEEGQTGDDGQRDSGEGMPTIPAAAEEEVPAAEVAEKTPAAADQAGNAAEGTENAQETPAAA